jgi:outer membrane protein assembly factor BamE (lipoprotein component of BamABCDE complex)
MDFIEKVQEIAQRKTAPLSSIVMCRRETMIKIITIIGFLSLAVTFNSYAQDSDRIAQMEKEIKELKLRISKIESLLSNPSSAQKIVPSGEGWKYVANWRKLSTGMNTGDVRKILGEPYRLDGGNIATWYYKNDGIVRFYKGKVHDWEEPRQ